VFTFQSECTFFGLGVEDKKTREIPILVLVIYLCEVGRNGKYTDNKQ